MSTLLATGRAGSIGAPLTSRKGSSAQGENFVKHSHHLLSAGISCRGSGSAGIRDAYEARSMKWKTVANSQLHQVTEAGQWLQWMRGRASGKVLSHMSLRQALEQLCGR